ncbi:MAG: PAS domain S-box protein, partial [Spirochaetaceae bacterium]|nr:PAS domain S-box protein [Spirochaetaceae bacterium]
AFALVALFVFRTDERRRAAEREELRNAASYKAAQVQSLLGIVQCDLAGKIKWVNPRFASMLEEERSDLSGADLVALAESEPSAGSYEAFAHLSRGEREGYALERCFPKRGGGSIWIGFTLFLVRDDSGVPDYVAAIADDITARKRAQNALAESELRYRTLIELLPQKVYLKGRDSSYLSCNTAYAQELGVTPAGALGKSDEDFFAPELAAQFRAEDQEVMESGKAREFEAVYPSFEGGQRWMRAVKVPVPDGSGGVSGVMGVFFDITEQKRMTEEIRAMNEELESRVRERTAQLEAAKEAAEAAFKARSEFLANVSHEIRTPLNALIGFSEFFDASEVDPKKKEYLRTMRASGRSLVTLVNDILDLSRIEAGRLSLDSRPVDLRALLGEVGRVFAPAAAEKGLSFSVEVGDDVPPFIISDEARLRQALVNLVGNAVKFTESGGVSIRVQTRDFGQRLEVIVADSGIGVPAMDQERIFEPFSQQSPAISNKYGGTGLGLAITKRLVEAMNGGISVRSELGSGASFTLDLPCHEATGADASVDRSLDRYQGAYWDAHSEATEVALRARAAAAAVRVAADRNRPRLAALIRRAHTLGSGALSISAVGQWASDLKIAGVELGSEPVASFAEAFAVALSRFDLAAVRESLTVFGSACADPD